MTDLNLYKAIFKRKSIRKYDSTPLDSNTLSELEKYIDGIKPLYENIKTNISIVSQDAVNSLLTIKAPQYIIITSENKEGYLTNAGYILQHIDLYLSLNNIGSCYLGMAMPAKATKENIEDEFIMVMAFGNAIEPLHRNDVLEFKRNSLIKITSIANNDNLLEAARLAPSATNSQPWFFTGDNGTIHAYCIKPNIIKAIMYEKMNKIDMGIALCHLKIAASHFGKTTSFVFEEYGVNNQPKGYYYIATMKCKQIIF